MKKEDQDLHNEIDALAREIAQAIKVAKERNKKWEGAFDPTPRHQKTQAEALFS